MGKQSRRKREAGRGPDVASRYLRRAGLPARPDGSAYRRLAAAEPGWFERLSEAEAQARALAEDPTAASADIRSANRARYGLKYRDLDTALAEYASRPLSIAAAWLGWWSRHHPPAGRLLDVGCGPGVLTCAYALALPDAEVVGVDAVPEAVACAEQMARRVGAGNASFVVADYAAPGPLGGEFDQVVAVTALGDGGVYPQHRLETQDPFSSVADVDGPALEFTAPALAPLAGRLAPGGWFLAFDRTPYAVQAAWLGAALLHAGVDLDFRRAGVEPISEEGEKITFTRFAGTARPPSASAPAELARWVKSVEPPAYGRVWHDELRLERLKAAGATLVFGAEIDYAPHSLVVERREVWDHTSGAYGWVTTSLGLRELTRGPSLAALVEEYSAYASKWATSGLRVRRYAG